MNTAMKNMIALTTVALVGVPMTAAAQDSKVDVKTSKQADGATVAYRGDTSTEKRENSRPEDDDMEKVANGESADKDPIPKPPSPVVEVSENPVNEQAGVGSTIAYSEAGVLELGGSAGFSMNNSLTTATLSPSIGWFVADNIQLSGITSFTYAEVQNDDSVSVSALVEPSYHLPFSDTVFGFAGLGAGVSYIEGAGAGFAMQPRLGMNFLVGRSGVFTPAVNVGYSTVDADTVSNNRTLLTVEPSVGVQAGYTVMW